MMSDQDIRDGMCVEQMRKHSFPNVRDLLLLLLSTAIYIDVNTGMPGYSAELDIDDMLYITCYLND